MAKADFGLMLHPRPKNFPARELADFNRQFIRTLPEGFTTLWVEDHLEWGEDATIECLTTMAYFAAEFPAYHVGSLVMSQAYRNPALLAKMMANLQLLSGGRFILGLGAGWKEEEYRAYGYPFPDTRTRTEQLAEAAAIIKAMWTQRPATSLVNIIQSITPIVNHNPIPPFLCSLAVAESSARLPSSPVTPTGTTSTPFPSSNMRTKSLFSRSIARK